MRANWYLIFVKRGKERKKMEENDGCKAKNLPFKNQRINLQVSCKDTFKRTEQFID